MLFEFDERGNIIYSESFNPNKPSKKYTETVTYSNDNKKTEHLRYYPNTETLQRKEKRTYSNEGILSKAIRTALRSGKELEYIILGINESQLDEFNFENQIDSKYITARIQAYNDKKTNSSNHPNGSGEECFRENYNRL